MRWECMWDLLLGFCLWFFAIVIMVFTDFLTPKGAIYGLKWQEICFSHSVARLEDVSTMRRPDNTLFPSRGILSFFTDRNTNAENITLRLGLVQHPSRTLNKCNNLKMRGDKVYYSVLLFCDGLVILMWPTDKSVHSANSCSCFSRVTLHRCKKCVINSGSGVQPIPHFLYHSSDATRYSSADFFKKLFCILEIVSMVTMIVCGVF